MLYALDTRAAHKNFHDKLRQILFYSLKMYFVEPKIIFSTDILYSVTYSKAEANILYIPKCFLSDK